MNAPTKPARKFSQAPETWTAKEVADNVEWLNKFAERWEKKRDQLYRVVGEKVRP